MFKPMDHIFIDLGLTTTDIKTGEISALSAVRTNGRGTVLVSFCDNVRTSGATDYASFPVVADDMLATLLSPNYSKEYVIVAAHAETDRQFLKAAWKSSDLKRWTSSGHKTEPFQRHAWIDILQLAWPLCYNEEIPMRSFAAICNYFGVENKDPDTTMGNCEALVRCYWAMMSRYKAAIVGEGIIRGIGGKPYEALVSFFK